MIKMSLKHKSIVAVLLSLTLAVTILFTGCRNSNLQDTDTSSYVASDEGRATGEITADSLATGEQGRRPSDTRVIVDMGGREVTVPTDVKTVVPLANALRMMCYLDLQDMVVGVEDLEKEPAVGRPYSWVYQDEFLDLPIVGQGGAGVGTPFVEEIIKLNPDVIIAGYPPEGVESLEAKTGIPVVMIETGNLFEDDYDEALSLIGEVCGAGERAESVIDYIQEIEDDLDARTADLPDERKPTVYAGAISFKGGHGIEGTYSNFPPFVAVHARAVPDLPEKLATGVIIEKELVLTLDPEIIFLDPNNMEIVKADYERQPEFYEALSAVRGGRVYAMPGFNWYHTNVELALADCYYAGSIIFPDQFEDVDPEKKAEEIYSFLLGAPELYADQVAAGIGFGALTMGE